MTHIPIIDTSPIGDQDSVSRHSGGIGSVSSDLSGTSKKAKASFEKALGAWEGGPRRSLFQHAATGIQAELLTLITAASSASDLTDTFFGALKSNNDDMNQVDSFWSGKQLEWLSSKPTQAEIDTVARSTSSQASAIRSKQRRFAALIAADIDKITDLLVPGGSRLSPTAIARKVHEALGDTRPGSPLTQAQVNKVLGIAAKAAPPGASKENGDLDLAAFARSLNDKTVAGTTLGGEGWAIANLVKYHSDAAKLAHETNVQYAQITGESLTEVEASRLGSEGTPSSILRFAAEEDKIAHGPDPKAAALADDIIKGGPYSPRVAGALGILGLVGDYTTLQHLDEIKNPTERTAVKYASWANALGISRSLYTTLLAANSGDEVPGWGEAVATLTGVFLAGDYVYHEGPNIVRNVKDGIVQSLKNWAMSTVLHGFG